MRYTVSNYEWELNGDLDCSVWLDFEIKCKCDGVRVWDAEILVATIECAGVTFSINRSEIICDGCRDNPPIPSDLANWFVSRFAGKCVNDAFAAEVAEQYKQKIIAEYYDSVYQAA